MKKLLASALLYSTMIAAAPANAATALYGLSIVGNNVGYSADTPTFTLTNTSTYTGASTSSDALSSYLTSFKLSFTGSSYIDLLTGFATPTSSIAYTLVYPDSSANDTGTPGFLINFNDFNAGDIFSFEADFDLPGGANASYRTALQGAQIELGFADGTKVTQTLSGFNNQTTRNNFSGGTLAPAPSATLAAREVEAVTAAVPEPATWAMMILGFGVIGASMRAVRRRKVSFALA